MAAAARWQGLQIVVQKNKRCFFDVSPLAKKKTKTKTSSSDVATINSPVEEEGLLVCILSFLPLCKLIEMRRVCKLWDALLRSRAFLKTWSTRHSHGGEGAGGATACCSPWLVMVRKPEGSPPFWRELVAFDPARGTWISLQAVLSASCSKVALAALGGSFCPLVANPHSMPGCYVASLSDLKVVGSQDGLICCLCAPLRPAEASRLRGSPEMREDYKGAYDSRACYLLVLNPLTGSHTKVLPPTSTFRRWDEGISLQALPHHHYRVFLWSGYLGDLPGDLEIYDSRTRSWRAARSCCSPATDAKMGGARELEQGDLLIFSFEWGVAFAYNVELDAWSWVYAGQLPYRPNLSYFESYHSRVALVRHRGHAFLAAALFEGGTGPAGFGVWKVVHPGGANVVADQGERLEVAEWVEVARTPPHLWKGRYEMVSADTNVMQVNIKSSGSLIFMTVAQIYNFAHEGAYHVPLVYDLDRDLWYNLPPYKGCYFDVTAVGGMRPSLAAVASPGIEEGTS